MVRVVGIEWTASLAKGMSESLGSCSPIKYLHHTIRCQEISYDDFA